MAKKRETRVFTDAQRNKMLDYADKHGQAEACRHFEIVSSLITGWRKKYNRPASPKIKTGDRSTNTQSSPDLRSVQILLKQAEDEILQRIRNGGKPTKADSLVQLALRELEGR